MKKIELLAPAKDVETGLVAINYGADAVYIGAARFGARQAVGNSLKDIERLAKYAHQYWARVYATVNTLLFDDEIEQAVDLIHGLVQVGVDAIIIQDFGLLECDLPPIPLYASTQMHNHTPERVAFLEKVGIQRVILARELSLPQISAIRAATTIELETFIHGALCVCYSGQCHLSYAIGGRSGNRGQCAQPCRRPYRLVDQTGNPIVQKNHLLSLKDLNLTEYLQDLLDVGVCSFKIEGRLKDQSYVQNVVSHYRQRLDAILPDLNLEPSSSGQVTLDFEPDPTKTFNRGFTSYTLTGQRDEITSWQTPKHAGEPIGIVTDVSGNAFKLNVGANMLNNGDGLTFFDREGQLRGMSVNRVEEDFVFPAKMSGIFRGAQIHRNADREFLKQLGRSRPDRRIPIKIRFYESKNGFNVSAQDQDGNTVSVPLQYQKITARNPEQAVATLERQLTRLGGTLFRCDDFELELAESYFLPVSVLNTLRRDLVEALLVEREHNFPRIEVKIVPNEIPYPQSKLSFLGNVLNSKAEKFYRSHGVMDIEPAAESGLEMLGHKVMTTKHCIKYELGGCPHQDQPIKLNEPLYLEDQNGLQLRLSFNCRDCLMEVYFERAGR
ncbi:MAG: peptidase U32 family protein [Anaerolineales bacterium]